MTMSTIKFPLHLLVTLLLSLAVVGCKTIPSSSSGTPSPSSGSPSSSGEESTSTGQDQSSESSGSTTPSGATLPGSSMPTAGLPGQTTSDTGKASGASKDEQGTKSETETLSEALEAFERSRNKKSGDNQDVDGDAQTAGMEETDFPIYLPDSSSRPGEEDNQEAAADATDMEAADTGTPSSGGGAQTNNEQIAVLDRQLEESYGKFEGMIIREREYVRGRENERGADVDDDEQGPLPGEETGGQGGTGGGETQESISGGGPGNRPDNPDQREGDFQQAAVVYPPPPDIPDGTDDDVVARQLREAAMKEPDPELRKKLWEEYRKYKNKSK